MSHQGTDTNIDDPGNPFRPTDSLVPVTLVPEPYVKRPRRRLQFGIGSLFVCTVIFGVQFALISYFGAWFGFTSPILVLLIVAALAIGNELRWWKVRFRRQRIRYNSIIANRGLLYLVLLAISGYLLGGAEYAHDGLSKYFLKLRITRSLGFDYGTINVWHDGRLHELVRVNSVVPGGEMHQAGIKKSDVIVTEMTEYEFLQMLRENRSQTVNLTIERGRTMFSEGLDDSRQFQVELSVPP